MNDKWKGSEFTWVRFLEEPVAMFYPITIQRWKEDEFIELGMSGNMTVMQ